MVLVDTSIWIRFLSGREPYATRLDELLSRDDVAGHDFVYGELLIGDRGGRVKLLAAYAQMQQAPAVGHLEAVEFVRVRKLLGRGLGWIDVHILASAVLARLDLWTADSRVAAAAEEVGVAFDGRH